jgi:hypothetical protein
VYAAQEIGKGAHEGAEGGLGELSIGEACGFVLSEEGTDRSIGRENIERGEMEKVVAESHGWEALQDREYARFGKGRG